MTKKTIKASDVLGDNYYIYELTSSNYTPNLNGTITITCICKDIYGDNVANKSLTLYQNGTSKGAKTTNSNGVATWSITCSTAGLQKFNIKDRNIEVFVDDSKTILFEDDCSSADGLTNYGSSIAVRGADSTMTMTYDSTENAYKCSGSNDYYSMIPIPTLNNQDRYIIEADFKAQNITYNGIGLCLNDPTINYSFATWIEPWDNKVIRKSFSLNYDSMVSTYDNLSFNSSKWYHIKFTIDGEYITWGVYDENVQMVGRSDYFPTENRQMGIILLTQNGTANSTCYVKNIKAEALSEDISDSILYTTEELELATPTTSSNVTYKYKDHYGSDATLTFSTLNRVRFPYPSLPDFESHTSVEIIFDIEIPYEEFIITFGDFAIFSDASYLMCGGFTDYQYADYNLYDIDDSLNNLPSQLIMQIPANSQNYKLLFNGRNNGEPVILDVGYVGEICYSDNININKVTAKSLNFPTVLSRFVDDIPKIKLLPNDADLNYLNEDRIYLGLSNRQYSHCPVENQDFILVNQMLSIDDNYYGQEQILLTIDQMNMGYNGIDLWMRYYYQTGGFNESWTKFMKASDLDMDQINLFASKQKLDENEKFTIFANVKDNNGNPIENKSLTLIQKYDTYSNPDMSATGWVRDVGFYVNDTIFKGDWSCRFEVNSDRNHTGLQLYTSSEQRILFSTLGAYITSNIKITCTNNIITINVDGTDYGTTYTQNSNGTKVGFFTHEDYTVSIKDFVVNNAMLYKDCGSQTTDSNGNCSWNFNDGLPQGLYSFSINNTNLDIFVDALIDYKKYKTFPTTITQTIFNSCNGAWSTPINVPDDATIKFKLTTNSISNMVGEYLIYMGEIDDLVSTAFYIGIINSKFTIGLGCSGDEYYPPIPDNLSNGVEIGFKIDEIEITDNFGENVGYHEYDISYTYFINDEEYHHTFSTEITNDSLPTDWNRIIAAQTGRTVITKLRLERPLMSNGIYDNSPQLVTSDTIFDELSNNWFKKNEKVVHEIVYDTNEWSNFNGDWIVEGSTVTFITGENGYITFGSTLGVNNQIEINIENYSYITIDDHISGDSWTWHPNNAGPRNVFTITLPTYTLTTINGNPGYTWNVNVTCNGEPQSFSAEYANMIDDGAIFNNNEKATMLERNHLSEVQGDIKRIEYTKSYKAYHPENNNFNLITSDGVYHAIDAFFDTIYPIDSTYITNGDDPNYILRGGWISEDTFTADNQEYTIWRRVG